MFTWRFGFALLILAVIALVQPNADALAQSDENATQGRPGGMQNMMGGGVMMGSGMGQGMMGMHRGEMPMMRHMMMGPRHGSMSGLRGDRPFTADEMRRIVDGQLALHGFSRLKVGDIEPGEDTFSVGIVTLDDSLAMTLTVDRKTARIIAVE